MHGFKRLGERVMARTFGRQVVELHVRVACARCHPEPVQPNRAAANGRSGVAAFEAGVMPLRFRFVQQSPPLPERVIRGYAEFHR